MGRVRRVVPAWKVQQRYDALENGDSRAGRATYAGFNVMPPAYTTPSTATAEQLFATEQASLDNRLLCVGLPRVEAVRYIGGDTTRLLVRQGTREAVLRGDVSPTEYRKALFAFARGYPLPVDARHCEHKTCALARKQHPERFTEGDDHAETRCGARLGRDVR